MVQCNTSMENSMSTKPQAATVTKPAKDKKPAPTPVQRVTDLMKRSALQGKISKDELDVVANLAAALKTFISA